LEGAQRHHDEGLGQEIGEKLSKEEENPGGTTPPASQGPAPLTKDANFLKFWIGQSISVFGSQFSGLAIPILAYSILNAQPIQFGILGFLGSLAFLLFSLNVGVYVDRHRKRSIMIYADFGRAAMLAIIPAAYLLGFLSVNLLYVFAFLTGLLTVFFEISYQSYIPFLVSRSQLVDANGKLEATRAISSGFGPGLASAVITVVGAPLAVVGDTLGYLSSAVTLLSINKVEEKIEKTARSTWHDLREGLSVVLRERRLWQIAACTSTANLFSSGVFAIIIPYFLQRYHFSYVYIGIVFAVSAVGAILGAVTAARLANRIGVGGAIIFSAFIFGLPTVGIYFASGNLAVLPIGVALFATGFGSTAYNVNQVSYRQALVKREVLGRMNATMRFIVTGSQPIGALVGGILGQALGYQEAIGICVIGLSGAFLWVLFSPIRGVRTMPIEHLAGP
jgi:MFS family permease